MENLERLNKILIKKKVLSQPMDERQIFERNRIYHNLDEDPEGFCKLFIYCYNILSVEEPTNECLQFFDNIKVIVDLLYKIQGAVWGAYGDRLKEDLRKIIAKDNSRMRLFIKKVNEAYDIFGKSRKDYEKMKDAIPSMTELKKKVRMEQN